MDRPSFDQLDDRIFIMGYPKMTDDERAIRQVVATWMTASGAGDVATVLSLMTEDVVFMVPCREPFGKAEFASSASSLKGMTMEAVADIREVRVLGDWAYLRNHLVVTMTPPGGTPIRRSGYTLTIMRKESDGQWRLARDANLVT
jgi:uncharacterized protein (TIGR02246 family)